MIISFYCSLVTLLLSPCITAAKEGVQTYFARVDADTGHLIDRNDEKQFYKVPFFIEDYQIRNRTG